MKFDFRKVVSVLASAVMIGSTLGIAAAANYPAPFVSGGTADGAIVVTSGSHVGAVVDWDAAVSAQSALQALVTTGTTSTSGTVTGEAKAIETSGQKLYIGDFMNNTKEAFTKTELPVVLADGKIIDTDGTSYDYNLKIKSPNTEIKYGRTVDNLATPTLYMDLESSSENYQMEVVFPTAVNTTKLANKDITLFGRKYTFTGSTSELTTTKVVLFESSEASVINSGESKEVTIAGTKYTIAVTSVEDQTHATISVNGVSESVTEGSSYKISGLDMYVKNVIGPTVAGETRAVELYAGSAKLTLENGNDVVKGAKTLYGARTTISTSGSKVSKIAIVVTPYSLDDRIKYVKQGGSITDPVFGTFKIDFATINPELEDASKEIIKINPSAEQKGRIQFTNKAGKSYDLEIFKPSYVCINATGVSNPGATCDALTMSANYTRNSTTLGQDQYWVIASTTGIARENDYFITRNNEYSQIWRVDRIDPVNKKIKVRDAATGGDSQEITLNDSQNGAIASLNLADGSSATVTMSGNNTAGGGPLNITVSKADPLLYTKGGAKIDLTDIRDAVTHNSTPQNIVITEETSYNDGDFKNNGATTLGGIPINVSMYYDRATRTGYDMVLKTPFTFPSDAYSASVGDYDVYSVTTYGSFIKQTGTDDKTFTMYYPKAAASLGVFIGEIAAAVTPGTTGGAGGQVLVVKDTEVDSVKDKNLLVIGGSCVNSVARKIIDATATAPICAADFTAKTNVGAGQYLIKAVESPYNTAKVAVLAAGYEAADTKNAVAKLKESHATDKGTSNVYPVTSA